MFISRNLAMITHTYPTDSQKQFRNTKTIRFLKHGSQGGWLNMFAFYVYLAIKITTLLTRIQ